MCCIIEQVQNLILVVCHCSDVLYRKGVVLPQKVLHFFSFFFAWEGVLVGKLLDVKVFSNASPFLGK